MYFLISPLTPTAARSTPRRGITLLVVITMLGLFAIVGVGFVIYASSEATGSRYSREAKTMQRPDTEAEAAFHFFMTQLLYGSTFDAAGCQSVMRSHSMADNMFACNPYFNGGPVLSNIYSVPYSGIGRPQYTYPANAGMLAGQNYANLVNPQFFSTDTIPDPVTGAPRPFVLDPDFSPLVKDLRTSPSIAPNPLTYMGGCNPSYTYPDLNTMFVAAVNGKGEILLQSFHRPWTGIGGLYYDPNDPTSNQNWAVTAADPLLKYKTLRPLPSYNTYTDPVTGVVKSFPPPEDGGGDVKQWYYGPGVPNPTKPGTYYNNDSIWMDMGFPVTTGPNGIRYKVLFAPLIVPLDGKLNLNVHGNILNLKNNAAAPSSSNQGFGPWEVNIARILNNQNEYPNLFLGKGVVVGKYGPDGQPTTAGSAAGSGVLPHFYAQVDFDGLGTPAANGNNNFRLPNEAVNTGKYFAFPKFNKSRFDNGVGVMTNHPSLYNPFSPAGDDVTIPVGSLEALWRYGDTGSPALGSDLFKLCPTVFTPSGLSPKMALLFTTSSADLTWPGAPPWARVGTGANLYQLAGATYTSDNAWFGAGNPTGSPSTLPLSSNRGEYGVWLQSLACALGPRLNINQALPSYPTPDPTTGMIDMTKPVNVAQYQAADKARQKLAKNIFDRLVLVTTGRRPNGINWPAKATAPNAYNAMRWLAQLAVNMVDYRDEDDIITAFQWNPNDPTEYVYGTELPRVVINEVYSDMTNGINMAALNDFNVRFWLELHNPFAQDTSLTDSGTARLQTGTAAAPGYAVYQIKILKKMPPAVQAFQTNLRDPANPAGDPNVNDVVLTVDDYTPTAADVLGTATIDTMNIYPSGGKYTGGPTAPVAPATLATVNGYHVLGPQSNAFPGVGSNVNQSLNVKSVAATATTPQKGLTYVLPAAQGSPGLTDATQRPTHTIMLRRLANPYLPPQPTAGQANYNPYITIDYVEDVPTNLADSQDTMNNYPQNFTQTPSYGRKQTYTSDKSQWVAQQPLPAPATWTYPPNTFFRQNGQNATAPASPDATLDIPFDWLVHLDRQLISPMELLHVSAYPPALLTQQLKNTTGTFKHLAPWLNENNRLYRVLEFIQAGSRIANLKGHRVPGSININMVFDQEILQALADEQQAAGITKYGPTDITTMFNNMMAKRTPAVATGYAIPGQNDAPFKSLGIGVVPAGDPWQVPSGLKDTILRDISGTSVPTAQRMFEVPNQTHPYRKYELLTKIYNNLTVRSNTFAVFVTAGFFEVTDESVSPPRLGPEIGKAENRHVRYRMFAIVDRTQLAALQPTWATVAANAQGQGTSAGMDTVSVSGLSSNKVGPLGTWPPGNANLSPPFGPTANSTFTLQPGVTVNFVADSQNPAVLGLAGSFSPQGLLVSQVTPGSPAASAGLQANDLIVGMNGKLVTDQTTYQQLLYVCNGYVLLDVTRAGQPLQLVLTFSTGEVVMAQTVTQVNPNTFSYTAFFSTTHAIGATITVPGPELSGGIPGLDGAILGHPGPWPSMYANYYPTPVPYYTIIEGK